MAFVTIAQNFLNNPGALKSHPYYSAMRDGVFIGSKVGTGMFIIETIDDAREVVASIEHRINVEQSRLKILREIARQFGWIL